MSLPLKVVFVLSLLLSGGAAAPSFPVWPSQFSVDFNETTSGVPFLSGKTTGKFYYDAAHHRSLTTRYSARFRLKRLLPYLVFHYCRVNGKYDRYCGSERIGKSTACNHLVTNGIRYLVFPDLEFCCACCNAAAGCDILKPNWLACLLICMLTHLQTKCLHHFRIRSMQPLWEMSLTVA